MELNSFKFLCPITENVLWLVEAIFFNRKGEKSGFFNLKVACCLLENNLLSIYNQP